MLIIDILQREERIPGEPYSRVGTVDKVSEITPAMFVASIVDVTFEDTRIGVFTDYNSLMKWWNSGSVPINKPGTAETVASNKEKPSRDRTIEDHVDAPHYKNYMGDLQWIDTMSRLSSFEDPKVFRGALELTVRGYIDRMGKKDRAEQDILKAVWYLRYMAAYIANGDKPILIENIDSILANLK